MKPIAVITALIMLALQARSEEKIAFSCMPYLQNVTPTEATIVWATDRDAVSWVELAPDDSTHFYASERPKYYSTTLGKKNIGTLHRITVGGLNPATTYRYRVFSQEVTKNEDKDTRYGSIASTRVYQATPPKFTTPNPAKRSRHIAVVNDIHEDSLRLRKLLSLVDMTNIDFMVLNGDMVNNMDSISQAYNGFLNSASTIFAAEKPFYMIRGNHETRGKQSQQYMQLYSTPTSLPYYMVREGDICIVALDGGEDKPDSDIEYNGLADFDRYRSEQAEWLSDILQSEEYLTAPVKLIFLHVPPGDASWHGEIEINKKFVPLLNRANVTLMLCGHLHKHIYYPAGKYGMNFPVIINSNHDIIDLKTDGEYLKADIIEENGNLRMSLKLPYAK